VSFGSAVAVAAQALRRTVGSTRPAGTNHGQVHVLLSGRPGQLPPAALRYPEGRLLAGLPGESAPRQAVVRQS
jgi:glutamate racemase